MKLQLTSSLIKVLFLAPQRSVGGIATWARILLSFSNPEKIAYRVIDTSRLYVEPGQRLGIWGTVLGLRDALKRIGLVLMALITFRPHLVYITTAPSIGLLVRDIPLIILLKCLCVKVVLHLHGGNLSGFFGDGGLRRQLSCWGLRCCHAVFVITRQVEKVARQRLNPNRVFYVPNMIGDELIDGIADRQIQPLQDGQSAKLIHVAWQTPEKGSLDVIEAIKNVKVSVSCDLVGVCAPENAQVMDRRIAELSVADRIKRVGQKKGSELKKIYQTADIFLLPTHLRGPEGFPMVILEAMAYGLPIIANDVGNIREMIGFDTEAPAGWLLEQVAPIDPKELADKIDRLWQDAALRQQMSHNGRKRVKENYLASKVVPSLESLLVELAAANPTPQSINTLFEQKYL